MVDDIQKEFGEPGHLPQPQDRSPRDRLDVICWSLSQYAGFAAQILRNTQSYVRIGGIWPPKPSTP